ncbi:hornerin-like [Venturia canescens]|uniref:hornerin-like n=1 Tax=Venturia canescens TaxID=32260 RepID=UPI001C9CE4AC|nr:hornerin-like [Venturia canescens]
MWSKRIFLVAVLLVKVNARPDGYGVKGGRFNKATGSAVANAQATAYANAASFGTAKSSASAIATASANGDGSSNAVATADASIDGGNVEKDEGEKENGNANELGASDDLRQPNDRGGATEYKCVNHRDGTATWNPRNPHAEHVASGGDDADSSDQSVDEPDCSPAGVKGHRGTSGGASKNRCRNTKPNENAASPGQSGDADSSAGWQHAGGENSAKASELGTIDRNYAASPCRPGDSECLPGAQGSYGDPGKPGSSSGNPSASPCANGASKCPATSGAHPSHGKHPHPGNEEHPKPPAASLEPPEIGNSYGPRGEELGTAGGSQFPISCADGSSKCSRPEPSALNPYPSVVNPPGSSAKPPGTGNKDAQHNGEPGTFDSSPPPGPCASGGAECSVQTPNVPSPHPTSGQHPHSSNGPSRPSGHTEKPGMVDRSYAGSPCGPGGSKCFVPEASTEPGNSAPSCAPGGSSCVEPKPSTSRPHSTFGGKPDGPLGPIDLDGTYGGANANPDEPHRPGSQVGTPCAAGDSKCASSRPTLSGHHPGGFQHPIELPGHGGSAHKPGTLDPTHSGRPCAAGGSKCPAHQPSVSKPHRSYGKNPDLSTGSSSPSGVDGGYGASGEEPETVGGPGNRAPCAPPDWKCLTHEQSQPSPYPTHNTNPWTPPGKEHSIKEAGGSPGRKPETSNPFLNGDIDLSSLKGSPAPEASSGAKINPLNPFLYPQNRPKPPTGSHHPNNQSPTTTPQNPGPSYTGEPQVNPSNPFLFPQGQRNPSSGIKHPGAVTGVHSTGGNTVPHNQVQPAGANVPATGGCHGPGSCTPNQPAPDFPNRPEYAHGEPSGAAGHHVTKPNPPKHSDGESPPGSGHHEPKPAPPNPFFPGTGHGGKPEDSERPEASNQKGRPASQSGGNKNPFFTSHELGVQAPGAPVGHEPGQRPDSHGPLASEPGSNPFLGNKQHSSDQIPQAAHGCGSGTATVGCSLHNGPTDESAEGHEPETTTKRYDYGVKGHRAGVKGGSRGPPTKLEGSLRPGENGHFGPGQNPSAQSSAVASAHAFSHASASSSSSSTGGQSSASAKSEAYSSNQSADGLSGSWASSRASAHASAFASSYSSSDANHGQGGATLPEIPAQ